MKILLQDEALFEPLPHLELSPNNTLSIDDMYNSLSLIERCNQDPLTLDDNFTGAIHLDDVQHECAHAAEDKSNDPSVEGIQLRNDGRVEYPNSNLYICPDCMPMVEQKANIAFLQENCVCVNCQARKNIKFPNPVMPGALECDPECQCEFCSKRKWLMCNLVQKTCTSPDCVYNMDGVASRVLSEN